MADYGQLELRLLAHMADCASMLQAFRLGGDFHSRTALGMYDHIKAAIQRGESTSHVVDALHVTMRPLVCAACGSHEASATAAACPRPGEGAAPLLAR